jgi:hypothetical protein
MGSRDLCGRPVMHLGHAAPVRDARVACTDRLLSREHQRIVVFVLNFGAVEAVASAVAAGRHVRIAVADQVAAASISVRRSALERRRVGEFKGRRAATDIGRMRCTMQPVGRLQAVRAGTWPA